MKTQKRWLRILAWLLRGVITPEEGLFLLAKEMKKSELSLSKKEYSLR